MAKKPLVHCRICKGVIDRNTQDNWVMPQEKWYYHKNCYADFAKKKGAIKEKDLSVEADDDLWKDAVYEYLKKDLKMSLNFNKFSNQWESYLKKGMTAKGIYFTLRYFYEIEKGDSSKSEDGIGIVPYIYERGTCYWGERNQRDKGICARIEAEILQVRKKEAKIIFQTQQKKRGSAVDLSIIADLSDEED